MLCRFRSLTKYRLNASKVIALCLSLFLPTRYTAPMPRIEKNGLRSPQEPKAKKTPALSANDLFALRDFVNQRLSSPTAVADNPLPLSKLIEENPAAYAQAIDLLSAGHSPQAVANSTGLPLATVKAASHFIPDYRTVVRSATSRNLSLASLRMSEVLFDRADQLHPDRLGFTLAVAVEKSELLSGGITQRTEHRVVSREELQQLFDALPKARDVKVFDPPTEDKNKQS
jgi:hypothetical protein